MKIRYIYLILVFFVFTSCHTTKHISEKKTVPVITENKLYKHIDQNALQYNTLFAKRVNVSFSNKKKTNNFRATLKIQRDQFIQISLSTLFGMEVARVLFTTDSIKFVDFYHKSYFLTDYDDLRERYDVSITYELLENLFTNTFFNLNLHHGKNARKKYKFERSHSGYELSTIEERALSRKIKKFYKKKRKNKDFILILHRVLIDPYYFRPSIISMEDIEDNSAISVSYSQWKDFSGKIFPEKVAVDFTMEQNQISLKLDFQRIEFDLPVESNLKILSKYKKIE